MRTQTHALQNPTHSLYKQKLTSRFYPFICAWLNIFIIRTKIKPEDRKPIIPSVCVCLFQG